MERNDVIKVYDTFLKYFENIMSKGGLGRLDGDTSPMDWEPQLKAFPILTDDDIANIKDHSTNDIDTCIKFIMFYSFYIVSEPDIFDIIRFVKDETNIQLDTDAIKRMQIFMNELYN